MGSKWVIETRKEFYMPVMWTTTPHKKYGLFKFLGDIFMVFLTSGLWLIWIFVREMRRR